MLPDQCLEPTLLCWRVRGRNQLAQGVWTPPLPPPLTHDVRCELGPPEVRLELVDLFGDPREVTYGAVVALASRHEVALIKQARALRRPVEPKSLWANVALDKFDCVVAYYVAEVLLLILGQPGPSEALAALQDSQVLDSFWYFALNWVEASLVEWPLLRILEFLAWEARRIEAGDLPSDAAAELWAAVESPGPQQWLSSASVALAPPRTPLGVASVHLAQVLAVLEDSGAWRRAPEAQALLAMGQAWLRAHLPRGAAPLQQLLRSAWPALALWGRIWRHPGARRLLGTKSSSCPMRFDPAWSARSTALGALASRWLPGGRWRHRLAASPAQPDRAAPPPLREAWAAVFAAPGRLDSVGARAWLEAARVLHASIRRHEDPARRRPFILLVEPGFLSEPEAAVLRGDGLEVRAVEPTPLPPELFDCTDVQLRSDGLRYRLWGLTEFDRILHIDLDALVVAPLDHLFRVPPGVFMSGTINGTRWPYRLGHPGQEVWDRHTEEGTPSSHWGHFAELPHGPPVLNAGVLLIAPTPDFEATLREALRVKFSERRGKWQSCDPKDHHPGYLRRLCEISFMTAFCAQGLTDALALALGRRLGDASFAAGPGGEGEFLGCASPSKASPGLRQPAKPGDHCILEEGYNLQVTLPNFAWHMPYLQGIATSGRGPWILHWPGRPKPWALGPGQRTAWDRLWWEERAALCRGAERREGAQCFLQSE